MSDTLQAGIIRILDTKGETVGAGFLVAERLAVTCAHVMRAAGAVPGGEVTLIFHAADEKAQATVPPETWRDPNAEDVAFLRLEKPLPTGLKPVLLGSSGGTSDHSFKTFGFPAAKPTEGMWGYGSIGDRTTERNYDVLQLTSTTEVTRGFSGAPVLDNHTRRIVGMITSITRPDQHGKLTASAFITPTETLRAICAELQLSDICPYRSLDAFTEADAEFFFGRQRVVDRLLARLRQEPRFLAVLGPSGSGKSSVVRAGLIPRLREGNVPGSDRWGMVVARPANNPFVQFAAQGLEGQQLETAVQTWLARRPEYTRLMLVIDQFEELLVTTPEPLRREFVPKLTSLLESPLSLTVILVIRADFYSRFSQQAPALLEWLEKSLVNIPYELTRHELTAMVRRPAEAVALRFETGLLDVIVDSQLEVASTPENGERVGRSTILPLLEFALTRLWDRRQDGVLTHAAYNAIGGVVGGLTQWADLAYCSLPQEQRLLARRVLTELVHLDDESQGLPDSRRRKSLTALARGEAEQAGTLDQVIQQLANARLLVTERDPSTGQESVEIIHEALLREWKTFQDWLAKDRQFLTWRQEIEPRVRAWNETNPDQIAKRDEGKLLRGGDLVVAAGWLAERGADLTQGEREYCQASIALHEREAAQQERQRQLERTRNRIIGLLGALGVVVALIAVVFWSRSARLAAERQSLALAGSASRALDDRNPDLALALALKASAIKAPPEAARIALIEAAYLSSTRRRMSVGEGWVLDVDISPDGLYLVSGSSAGRVSLWNLGSGGEIQRFIPGTPSGPAWSVAFSPDGRAILAGYESGDVILWNISTGTAMLTMKGHTAAVRGLAFTPDGHTAVTGSLDKSLILWDVANGQRVRTFTGHKGAILSVDMSPDGKTIVSGSEDKTLIVWDSTSGEVIRQLSGHSGYVLCVAFSPDGNLILSGSADSSLRLWSTQTGAELRVLKGHTNWVHSVVFSPDGRSALSASADRSLMLWDISAGRMAQQLDGHSDEVQSVAIAHDGDLAVSGARDSSLRVWDIRAFKETGGSSQSMGAEITSVAVDPSGARLLTGLSDGRIALWSTRSGTVLKELPPHSAVVSSVAFSPDGHQALTGSHDMTLALWDVAAGAQIHSLKRQTGAIRSVTFSHDGRAALAGTIDAKVAFWDFAGSAPRYFEGHTNIVTAVRSSPDGKTAVSGSHDHSLILWDLDSGRQIRRYLGHDSWVLGVDFSPDGQTIVSASADRTLILWETGTGRIIHRLRGHDGMVLSVSFSPDGQTLLSGSSDGMLILWSTASGRPLRRFNFLPDASCALDERCWWVWGVAFSPQADRVFSGSADGRWRTWPVLPSDVDQLRNWVQQNRYTRALTPQEQQQYGISDQ